MSSSSPASRRPTRARPFLTLLLLAATACLEQKVSYTRAEDEAAMVLVASAWTESGGGDLVLSLCEDVAATDAWTGSDCQEDHVVRGGGRALEHTESRPTMGCGGCPFTVVTYVVGTISGGPLAAPATVRGQVTLGSWHDEDPYAPPWGLRLQCEGADACAFTGTIGGSGALEGSLTAPGSADPLPYALDRTGDAICP